MEHVYALDSLKNVYNLAVGEHEFNIFYEISNATVDKIYTKENLSYENHYWYSLVIAIGNSTNIDDKLTITLPSELMVSTCQSGISPEVSINNGTFNSIDEISASKANYTVLIDLPPFTKNIEIRGYGPNPGSGCPTFAYNMTYDGKRYWIDYKSNPEIQEINMTNSTLVVALSNLYHFPPPQPWSYVDIQIPRNLIDSKMGGSDVPFTVLVDGNATKSQELETTNTTRTLHIPLRGGLYYQDNDGKIEIIGTTTISEFPFASVVLLVSIMTIIIVGYKIKQIA